MTHLTKFSFGITSAVVTSLAFIIGLSGISNPKMAIIGSLLVFAIADNISDALGIHIFQESDLKKPKIVAVSTFYNFFTRLFISAVFIVLVALLPTEYFIVSSLVWGIFLLSILSYKIGKEQKVNPYLTILRHLSIAVVVILVSFFLRTYIMNLF
jgi:VIT1/CCC1 family predicted Fe2+/Mn2+ transporter